MRLVRLKFDTHIERTKTHIVGVMVLCELNSLGNQGAHSHKRNLNTKITMMTSLIEPVPLTMFEEINRETLTLQDVSDAINVSGVLERLPYESAQQLAMELGKSAQSDRDFFVCCLGADINTGVGTVFSVWGPLIWLNIDQAYSACAIAKQYMDRKQQAAFDQKIAGTYAELF